MSRIAVLGERAVVEGFALAGALVLAADSRAEVEAQWEVLPGDVAVLLLTRCADERLRHRLHERPMLLTAAGPE